MFFDDPSEIPAIATRTNCAVFALSPHTKLNLKNALYLRRDDSKTRSTITIDQLREFLEFTKTRESKDRFFIITPADAMNEATQNAFLKTLEEPHDFYHFVLITENPNALLPTILSRAPVFALRHRDVLTTAPDADKKTLALAKTLIAASPSSLPDIAAEIAKDKTKSRQIALDATATAIEILYKSYFKTKNPKFLTKLPNFLKLHEALTRNGHVKLHIVADLC